jgi:hypothetical protein
MEPVTEPRFGVGGLDQPGTPAKSAASWSAIIAGAFVAVAVSLVLFALGSGLGFASISPWDGQGLSMTTFAMTTAIWLIVTQWLSSAAGGYIAGRLRPSAASAAVAQSPDVRPEVTHVIVQAVATNGTANQAKDNVKASADAARKAAAKTAIFTALALAVGAFIACLTAALGGKLRDEHP